MASTSINPIEMTEIYVIKNKKDGKCFIGRAKQFLYYGKKPHGLTGCWKSHMYEAKKGKNGDNPALHEAMLNDGIENFEIIKLETVEDSISKDRVKHYIQEYNCMSPNGYNLTDGTGKKSQESRNKIKAAKAQMDKEAFAIKMREINIGKTHSRNDRKHEEDADLPKYIRAIRKEGGIIGYCVDKFPIGEGERVIRVFKNKNEPIEALKRAKIALEELYEQYPHVKMITPKKEETNQPDPIITPNENILPILNNNNKVIGYYVEGENIPKREFKDSINNNTNLDRAVKYLDQITTGQIHSEDSELRRRAKELQLPKYIRRIFEGGIQKGYTISGLTHNNKKYYKAFTDPTISMEEKLKQAKEYLNELLKSLEIEAH